MKKLSIPNIVKFRKKSAKSKKSFAADLKKDKIKNEKEGGGDYWIIAISAVAQGFKLNSSNGVKEKIEELEGKFENTDFKRIKTMYRRNIDILYKYENFNYKEWRAGAKMSFLKNNKTNSVLKIKGLMVEAKPHHVFTYKKKGIEAVGAIWFVSRLSGYKIDELGMFVDLLYRYLNVNYSKKYTVSEQYCLVVDVSSDLSVSYSDLKEGSVPAILNNALDEINRFL